MRDGILVLNAGSSSIKFQVFVAEAGAQPFMVCKGQVEGIDTTPHFIALSPRKEILAEKRWDATTTIDHDQVFAHILNWVDDHLGDIDLKAVGHRVVHGGAQYGRPMLVTDRLLDDLARFTPLAPLHQPHNLAPIHALRRSRPALVHVACFDTAFHRSNTWEAQTFALPRSLTDEGVRRYGFHGLSYEYIARRLQDISPATARGRVVVAHLGNGASLCAMKEGRSLCSTMGFTAVDGLMMGTRTGMLDPGVVLYLMQEKGMGPGEIETLLYKQSGLLGVSGISNDMRVLLDSTDPQAAEAVDLFVYMVQRALGSLVAALEGVDALVFTGGIGENAAVIRARVCERAGWLGLRLDADANRHRAQIISTLDSQVSVWVIPTDEEWMIAHHTRAVLAAASQDGPMAA